MVRDLKSSKAEKSKIDVAVKTLLSLKAEFKAATGKDWTPNSVVAPAATTAANQGSANDINDKIIKQGNLVRDLKSSKAEKVKIDEAVKSLLSLKAEFKTVNGKDWTPGSVAPATTAKAQSTAFGNPAVVINEKMVQQGSTVRDLKSKKAEKAKIEVEVKALLAHKAEFKSSTGQDGAPEEVSKKSRKTIKIHLTSMLFHSANHLYESLSICHSI